jgi:hypothetical protein
MGLLSRLSKKAADHLRRMKLECCWQVEMALQGAISFENMPQISRFSDLSQYHCTASGRRKRLLPTFADRWISLSKS